MQPKLVAAYAGRGFAYQKLDQPERALQDFNDGIGLAREAADPQLAESGHDSRANAYDELGDEMHAIADYDAAIKLSPGFALYYVDRGIVFMNTMQVPRAITDFDSAIHLDPKDVQALRERGNARAKLRQFDVAILDH